MCDDVRSEVIENTRAAYRGWTHAFPYAGFDHLIFQDFKKSKRDPHVLALRPSIWRFRDPVFGQVLATI